MLFVFVFHRTYHSTWHIGTISKCLLRGASFHLQSAHICCDLGTDLNISGLLQSPAAPLWLLPSLLSGSSLFPLCPHAACFSQSGCSNYCETEVRPCHGSAQNLPVAFRLTQSTSLSLHRHERPCTASSNSAPNTLPSPTVATAAPCLFLHHILPGGALSTLCLDLLFQISSWLLLHFLQV